MLEISLTLIFPVFSDFLFGKLNFEIYAKIKRKYPLVMIVQPYTLVYFDIVFSYLNTSGHVLDQWNELFSAFVFKIKLRRHCQKKIGSFRALLFISLSQNDISYVYSFIGRFYFKAIFLYKVIIEPAIYIAFCRTQQL